MTKGVRTTSGSLAYKDHVPAADSAVAERVKASGAILLGKTNTPEFGSLGANENRLGDDCRNPWNTERTSGASSGGAGASVAAGLCSLGTGSDGGGSIRIPASFCGIYGIKPTQGRVSGFSGVPQDVPLVNLLGQNGPMTRTVKDSAILLAGAVRVRSARCFIAACAGARLRGGGGQGYQRTAHRVERGLRLCGC